MSSDAPQCTPALDNEEEEGENTRMAYDTDRRPQSESERTAAAIRFLQEKESFRPRLMDLLAKNPNVGTIEGLAQLAHTIQRGLYVVNGLTGGDTGRRISDAHTEFGARVPATLLDRQRITRSYEAGNLRAWLGRKGLDVQVEPGDADVHWSQGVSGGIRGKEERDYYFQAEDMTPGAVGAVTEYLSAKLEETVVRLQESPYENDLKVLKAASAVVRTVAAEVQSIAVEGKVPDIEVYRVMLGDPLRGIGLTLVEKS